MAAGRFGGFLKYLVRSAAMDRLGWILDGLDGQEGWGSDAADVLAPEFTAIRPATGWSN